MINSIGKAKKRRLKKHGSEKDFFQEIWEDRPHQCENCGVSLPEPARTYYFSHIKSKGAHPSLRYDKDNVQLLCYECHYAYDSQGKEKFNQRSK